MKKSEYVIDAFLQYRNLSVALDKRRTRCVLAGYDHSELNCLQCIGAMENPNVTTIAEQMHMTRGAISKIVQKLSEKGAITSYQLPGNRQKVFYTLTGLGRTLFDVHGVRHEEWRQEELRFYDSVDEEILDTVIAFMDELNGYLLERLKE